MKRQLLASVSERVGERARVAGFIHTIRNQGSLVFIHLRDRSGIMQLIVEKSAHPDVWAQAKELTLESVVEVTGLVKAEKQAPGGFEIGVEELTVLSTAEPELPMPVNDKGDAEVSLKVRQDWRWLDLRRAKTRLIFEVWTTFEQGIRDYLIEKRNFIQIHSPKLMSSPSESKAELFEVKYFERVAYLAQSPQFYKQMAQAAGFEGIFEAGPVFRADPSFTSRHATEFTCYDVEFSYIDSHHDVMDLEAEMLAHAIERVAKKHGDQIKEMFDREVVVPKLPFPKLALLEAKKILAELKIPSEKPDDLSPEEERAISEWAKKEHGHEFLFLIDYPITIRPFYHMRHADNPGLTKSFDLLWNGLEITTGAQREHRHDVLIEQVKDKGFDPKGLKHYLDFFEYGCPPHGGFGAGGNRLIMQLLGLPNVREGIYLFRGVKRLTP
jgi:aspartyl-tRNA synthetase